MSQFSKDIVHVAKVLIELVAELYQNALVYFGLEVITYDMKVWASWVVAGLIWLVAFSAWEAYGEKKPRTEESQSEVKT